MLRIALPCLVLLAGCTMSAEQAERADASQAREEARLAKDLTGFEAGKPTNCADLRNASVTVYGGDTLLYRDSGRRYWLNKPSGGCFGLKRDDIIVTKSYGSQLCRGDIVRTVDRTGGFPTGACSFGDFVPYTKPRG
ncbi:DUF6491 family protein [Sphingomonas sp.]|uniref:DUF6491 family protein n=1 Tax=Sphingomonas sp. TaxID=28214 RepID=UPI002CA7AA3C|nr:DUF6491 family protein [Sphingomonas sp.]HWK35141.1 DUF6491 family protein [Sphingomonas sp.]